MAKYSRNFLPILFNLFVAAPPERRGELGATVGCFAQITDAPTLGRAVQVDSIQHPC